MVGGHSEGKKLKRTENEGWYISKWAGRPRIEKRMEAEEGDG
jgi:hypothetical protein